MQIRQLQAADFSRWDAFVEACPEATFFHRAGWQTVLESALKHDTHFLYAEEDGHIKGVLPLAHVNSRLFGNALSSLAFCVYGGIAATDPRARQTLEAEACRRAESLGVDFLEMRNRQQRNPDWPRKSLYYTFRKAIDPDVEQNMKNIPRKQRAMVRKGIKAGLVSQWDPGIERFYEAYARSLHALGTPVFSRRYFQTLCDVFGEDCRILTVTHEGQLVASVMSFYFRDEVLPYYGGGTHLARALKGNDFMYWELMRRSCEEGLKVFDYGRSKEGTGSFSFKKNWGFEPEPLFYEYYLVRADSLPDINPNNPRYHLFIEAWKKLPYPLTKLLGPHIVRQTTG